MTAIASRMNLSTLYWANSDTELERRIANFIYQRGVEGGDGIRLIAQGGVVSVSGQIPTRSAKWLCIECCRRVAGVFRVIDEITIDTSVNERSATVSICREIVNRPRHQCDQTDAYSDQPSVRLRAWHDLKRRKRTASNSSKLMAAA